MESGMAMENGRGEDQGTEREWRHEERTVTERMARRW